MDTRDIDAIERHEVLISDLQLKAREIEILREQLQVLMPRLSAAENSLRRMEQRQTRIEHLTAGEVMKAHFSDPIGKIASDRQERIDHENAFRLEHSAAEARGLDLDTYRRQRAEREQTKAARVAAEAARIASANPTGDLP